MDSRKLRGYLNCGIVATLRTTGGKWKACILDAIHKGIKRPSELHRSIDEASPRVINMQLHELEVAGVVDKEIYPGLPLRVEYYLTSLGVSLLPVISIINEWGVEHKHRIENLDETNRAKELSK